MFFSLRLLQNVWYKWIWYCKLYKLTKKHLYSFPLPSFEQSLSSMHVFNVSCCCLASSLDVCGSALEEANVDTGKTTNNTKLTTERKWHNIFVWNISLFFAYIKNKKQKSILESFFCFRNPLWSSSYFRTQLLQHSFRANRGQLNRVFFFLLRHKIAQNNIHFLGLLAFSAFSWFKKASKK